jgi:hypothetical protein
VASALRSLEGSAPKDSRSIAHRVHELRAVLLADCLHGEVVRKRSIPRPLRDRYGISNLFVEDLPSFWRLLYTVVHEGSERHVVVLEIVDRRAYDRWFPGNGRGR